MTGTNVLIRGTTQFRARPASLFISIFHPSATSFDTFVDFSAPPLSVKCGTQNTSNRFILSSFPGNSKKSQKRLFKFNA